MGLGKKSGWWNSLAGGDFDGDGDIDIYLAEKMLLNDGRGNFTSGYSPANQGGYFGFVMSSLIDDFDGDGIIDIGVRRPSNQFWYIKNSSGTDGISGNSDGITRRAFGLQADDIPVPADYDGDNDLDIFVVARANDNPDSPKTLSRLFRNNNDGSFTDVTESAGLTNLLSEDEGGPDWFGLEGQKSGASWGDYNNDGFPDLFLTYSYKVELWRNLGNGTFANVTGISGFDTSNECINTGATWLDYNNDGFLDIYFSDWNRCASNSFYRNNGFKFNCKHKEFY